MTEVFMKEIAILDQINVEEIDIHNIQKENFPEYNEEIYISEDYKSDKVSKKKILTSECVYHKSRKLNNDKAEALTAVTIRDVQNNKELKSKIIRQKKV